ncbi:MAG: FHA domain-containing protein [Candidatus Acidiferrum sp.]
MQTSCTHCGQQHLLKDDLIAQHPKVQFRCTRCGHTTVVEVKRRVDETMVISPLPSFGKANTANRTAEIHDKSEDECLPVGMDIALLVTSGPDQGLEFRLKAGRTIIGRKGTDFGLNDPEISRHHCLLEVRGAFVNLKDLDSTNGTFFEGERIRAAFLEDGAEFRVGTSTIRVCIRCQKENLTPAV